MNSTELIERTTILWAGLQKKLDLLKVEKGPGLEYAQYALMESDQAIREIKKWVLTHDFACWENEITFFKNLKPPFIGKFIYYSKLVATLSALPMAGSKFKKKFYDDEFERLHFFLLENKEFISYYRKKSTYLDLKYFMRYQYDLDVHVAPDFHNYDEKFSTTHDHLVATIIANDDYEIFLRSQVYHLKETSSPENRPDPSLHWSSSKVALTELIFALHHTRCFNGGNAGLSETVKWFENKFNIDLGNYHKTMNEIRSRKIPRTKFLQLLTDNLKDYFEELDERES